MEHEARQGPSRHSKCRTSIEETRVDATSKSRCSGCEYAGASGSGSVLGQDQASVEQQIIVQAA